MKIGIPKGLFYFYYGDLWLEFFDRLNVSYIVSPDTNKEIKELGSKYASDEMCLSLKNYIGHVAYLRDKCDYILIPRIVNYGILNQTCTNFLACYDIINNLFSVNILNYNIDYVNGDTELDGFIEIGKVLGFSNRECREAYKYACVMVNKKNKSKINYNINCLNNNNKKILLVSHPYNTYDCTIGKPIINYLEELGCSVIYSDLFDKKVSSDKSLELCEGLYWKFSKEIVGSIKMCDDKIDGVIFLSTFPCGLDSLVNELIIRKLDKKCLNIVLDDLDSFAGIETRLESFVDIV